jgi:hypothetical protein
MKVSIRYRNTSDHRHLPDGLRPGISDQIILCTIPPFVIQVCHIEICSDDLPHKPDIDNHLSTSTRKTASITFIKTLSSNVLEIIDFNVQIINIVSI